MTIVEVLEAAEGPYTVQFLYQDANTNEPFWEDPYRHRMSMSDVSSRLEHSTPELRRSWRVLSRTGHLVTGRVSPADTLLYGVHSC